MTTIQIYKDQSGEYRWRLKRRNGRVLADSGEGYRRLSSLCDAVALIFDIQFEIGDKETDRQTGRLMRLDWTGITGGKPKQTPAG